MFSFRKEKNITVYIHFNTFLSCVVNGLMNTFSNGCVVPPVQVQNHVSAGRRQWEYVWRGDCPRWKPVRAGATRSGSMSAAARPQKKHGSIATRLKYSFVNLKWIPECKWIKAEKFTIHNLKVSDNMSIQRTYRSFAILRALPIVRLKCQVYPKGCVKGQVTGLLQSKGFILWRACNSEQHSNFVRDLQVCFLDILLPRLICFP